MDVITAIEDRRSVRAYLDKSVANDLIQSILNTARWAPSGVNHQPWKVTVLNSAARHQIRDQIIAARDNKVPENPDYLPLSPDP